MAEHYSRHADRRHLAETAIAKPERNQRAKRKTAADKGGKPEA